MFAGTFAGLLIIGNLKPMMLDFGLSEFAATLSISLFALGNIAGRVFWGQVHDRYGSRVTILLAKSFFFVTLLLLHAGESEALLLPATLLIGAGFGGCFVIYASTIVTKFGVRLFTGLYPVCFLGYGLAALIGPGIGGRLADSSGTFSNGINLSLAVVLSAIVLILAFYERNRENEMPQADLAIDND
jgi:OFA family oxalate/formate antiporter-like MFS transporter